MNPPPPIPHQYGLTTASANEVATPASTPFPPPLKISHPTSDARRWSAATAACGYTGSTSPARVAFGKPHTAPTTPNITSPHSVVTIDPPTPKPAASQRPSSPKPPKPNSFLEHAPQARHNSV